MEKLIQQQTDHYEALIEEEKQKSELLQKEIQEMRAEQKQEWNAQNEFNKRLEENIQGPKESWGWLFSLFRK
jgi:hypothetical protein